MLKFDLASIFTRNDYCISALSVVSLSFRSIQLCSTSDTFTQSRVKQYRLVSLFIPKLRKSCNLRAVDFWHRYMHSFIEFTNAALGMVAAETRMSHWRPSDTLGTWASSFSSQASTQNQNRTPPVWLIKRIVVSHPRWPPPCGYGVGGRDVFCPWAFLISLRISQAR